MTSPHSNAEPANLNQFAGPTPAEVLYAEKYTFIRPWTTLENPNGYQCYFKVDNQSIPFGIACEDAYQASWWCWMFAKALLKVGT